MVIDVAARHRVMMTLEAVVFIHMSTLDLKADALLRRHWDGEKGQERITDGKGQQHLRQ